MLHFPTLTWLLQVRIMLGGKFTVTSGTHKEHFLYNDDGCIGVWLIKLAVYTSIVAQVPVMDMWLCGNVEMTLDLSTAVSLLKW